MGRGLRLLAPIAAFAGALILQPATGVEAAQAGASGPVPDLNCAGAFQAHAVLAPSAERPSLRAARQAMRRYLDATPDEDPEDLEAFMAERIEPTVERLQSSADDMARHEETLVACVRQYALDPADFAVTEMAARVAARASIPQEDKRTPQQIYTAAGYAYDVEKRRDEGLALYRKACERDHAPACKTYAIYLRADRTPAGQKEAVWGFDRACQLGDGRACLDHASLVDPNKIFSDKNLRDWTAAERSYRKACDDYGEMDACNSLGLLLASAKNPAPRPEEGAAYRRKACDMGATDVCVRLAAEALRGN